MQMRVSSNTENRMQLEPLEPRDLAGFSPGDLVEVTVRVVPSQPAATGKKLGKGWVIRDPRTGLPALTLGEGAEKITPEDVTALLVDFP